MKTATIKHYAGYANKTFLELSRMESDGDKIATLQKEENERYFEASDAGHKIEIEKVGDTQDETEVEEVVQVNNGVKLKPKSVGVKSKSKSMRQG